MTQVLITGGAGFIGHHLAKAWLERGAKVRVLDNLRSGNRDNLSGLDVEFVEGSVEDSKLVLEAAANVDYVHHFAALVSVPESVDSPELTESININGTLNVLNAAREHGAKKVVLASSAAVYGTIERPVHRESDIPDPLSPYAITKLAGEYYLRMFEKIHGLPTVSLRYFNVFGPKQDPHNPYAAAIAKFSDSALKNEPITIFGDGEQTRDFIHVDDVVAANLLVAETDTSNGDGVYNVSRNERMTVNDLAKLIIEKSGSKSVITYHPPRKGDVLHSRGDATKLMELGWKPKVTLEEGIEGLF